MSISSRSAISCALRSGRTLNPMMMALEAKPSTSDSLIATPDRMMRILTLSRAVNRVGEHFGDTCTSAFTMSGSSLTPPSAICSFNDSSVRRPPLAPRARSLACLAERRDLSRLASATV